MPREPALPTHPTQRRRQGPRSAQIPALVRRHPSSGASRDRSDHGRREPAHPDYQLGDPQQGSGLGCQRPYEQTDGKGYLLPHEVAANVDVSEPNWAKIQEAAKGAAAKLEATEVQVMKDKPETTTSASTVQPGYSSKSATGATSSSRDTPVAGCRVTRSEPTTEPGDYADLMCPNTCSSSMKTAPGVISGGRSY
jgi:hypothetical protein